ncbi:MAG: 50S ribosomal protein L28 [Alphaproteobacteria bacterium]|nr:50S ribosomal protein L28 [Alphaproteobacteria bacterium]MBR1649465.1 50S ribosomal protein L28 [Alphaproteobacteria bacterium]
MVKKCDISGTGVMSGNNVSHANNRSRRRFMPNLQVVSLFSEALNQTFKLKVCTKTLRSIEHNGGLDAYLENTSASKLTLEALQIKKALVKVKGVAAKPETAKTVKTTSARVAKVAAKKAAK